MSEKFDYYYGEESESCSFYRIPRLLVLGARFSGLSTDAKLLYGLMLDRMNLSARNGWYDGAGRVYITITAQWSDNTTTELAPSDCKISGYSKTKHGTQTVTIAYGAYSETLNVKVLKRGTGTIKVSFTLLGDSIHDDKSGPHTLADNNLTEWLP